MNQKIESKSGKIYMLKDHPKSGWILMRVDTRSECKISESIVNSTREKLESGEEIPFTCISYTVAIETAVLWILRKDVAIDPVNRVYRKK